MTNRIFLIGTEKGGVGKTSISFNLAVLRAKAGRAVLLVDADKQASSAMWASMRTEAGYQPALVCVQKLGKIGHDLLQLKMNYDVIVDAGGADSQELRQAIAVADKWIIPVRPGQLELFSIAKMQRLLSDVKERVDRAPDTFVLLNLIAPSTTEEKDARAVLTEEDGQLPLMKSQLMDRVAMRRAVMQGCGLLELTGKSYNEAAAQEMLAVYQEVFGEVYDGQ